MSATAYTRSTAPLPGAVVTIVALAVPIGQLERLSALAPVPPASWRR